MTVLVTGAGGFLGRALVEALLARGEVVRATSRTAPARGEPRPGLIWHRLDLGTDGAGWRDCLEGVETIYHLAWSTIPSESSLDPVGDARVNLVGSVALLEAAATVAPGARVVFASSGGTVYGPLRQVPADEAHALRPISAYGVSKRAVEAYLELYGDQGRLRPASLRISNVFGPGQGSGRLFGAVTQFARRALSGEPIVMFGDGSTVRDYIYRDDAVEALLRAGAEPAAEGAFNIGTGRGASLLDIVAVLERTLGRPIAVERRPARPVDVPVSVLDPSRARRELGWTARTEFKEGVARTLDAMRRAG